MLFETPPLSELEMSVIEEIDDVRRATEYLLAPTHRWIRPLRRTTFARNIQASNSIEGHNVSLEDALAAATGGIPEEATDEDFLSVRNYGDAMTYVISLAKDPDFAHSADLIKSLHYMMMKHDLSARPGRWRAGPVYVWSTQSEQIVYDGPPSADVAELTGELVDWLNGPGAELPALIRGAMAHLNLVMIHPFKDGNGRMSRTLQSLVMARDDIIAPEFSSIEEYLGRNTPAYYDVLAAVGQSEWNPAGDARPWIRFVLTAHFRQAITVKRRMIEAQQTWEIVSDAVAAVTLDERMIYAVYLAAVGRKVRRADHIEFSDVSDRVASSDLKRLVDAGLLDAVGEKRGRHYVASARVANMRDALRVPRDVTPDPFER